MYLVPFNRHVHPQSYLILRPRLPAGDLKNVYLVIDDFIPNTRLGDVCACTLGPAVCTPSIYVNFETLNVEGERWGEFPEGECGDVEVAKPMAMFPAAPMILLSLEELRTNLCRVFGFLCVAIVPNPVCYLKRLLLFLLPALARPIACRWISGKERYKI